MPVHVYNMLEGPTRDEGPLGLQANEGPTRDEGPRGLANTRGPTRDDGPLGSANKRGPNEGRWSTGLCKQTRAQPGTRASWALQTNGGPTRDEGQRHEIHIWPCIYIDTYMAVCVYIYVNILLCIYIPDLYVFIYT